MKIAGIYLSGTGNTKHCMEKLVSLIDSSAKIVPIESEDAIQVVKENDMIILGYPTQFSNAPYMVRDFIKLHKELWAGKKVLCFATMGVFSGDGAGCSARLLKRYGAEIVGGLQVRMPDSVCDSKMLKKPLEENQKIIRDADKKIEKVAEQIKNGVYPKEGITFFAHLAGLFGQRLWYYSKTTGYSKKLKVSDACVGCGLCESLCPMKNITIKDGKAVAGNQCTMCYRCISSCPKQALTLIGKEVVEQCKYEKYVETASRN